MRAVGINPAPRAVYGTVSAYDDATKTLSLLGGSLLVDVSQRAWSVPMGTTR